MFCNFLRILSRQAYLRHYEDFQILSQLMYKGDDPANKVPRYYMGKDGSEASKRSFDAMGTGARAGAVRGADGYVGDSAVGRPWADAKLPGMGGGTNEAHPKNLVRDLKGPPAPP